MFNQEQLLKSFSKYTLKDLRFAFIILEIKECLYRKTNSRAYAKYKF